MSPSRERKPIDSDTWEQLIARERLMFRRLGNLLGTLHRDLPDADETEAYRAALDKWGQEFPERARKLIEGVWEVPSEFVMHVDNSEANS